MTPVITKQQLVNLDACDPAIAIFAQVFGESAEVTKENARRAAEAGLDVGWLVYVLLEIPARNLYWHRVRQTWQRNYWDALAGFRGPGTLTEAKRVATDLCVTRAAEIFAEVYVEQYEEREVPDGAAE